MGFRFGVRDVETSCFYHQMYRIHAWLPRIHLRYTARLRLRRRWALALRVHVPLMCPNSIYFGLQVVPI